MTLPRNFKIHFFLLPFQDREKLSNEVSGERCTSAYKLWFSRCPLFLNQIQTPYQILLTYIRANLICIPLTLLTPNFKVHFVFATFPLPGWKKNFQTIAFFFIFSCLHLQTLTRTFVVYLKRKKANLIYIYPWWHYPETSKYISFLLLFQDGEKLSNKVSGERRSSAIANKGLKIGNSHTSVIGGLHVL